MKFFSSEKVVWLVLVLAVLLRLPLLNGSFWLDEAAQALESARPLSQQLDIRGDFQPPLMHLLVHALLYVSRSEWWLRLGSALIPGVVTVWATYKIGEKLFSRAAGVVAAVLLATSSFHIFFSQELRPYSLPAMFATLSWLLLFMLVKKKPTPYAKEWPLWNLYALCSIAGLYTSYLYPFLFIAQGLGMLLFWRKRWWQWFGMAVVTGVTYLPWLPFFFDQLQTGQELRQDLPGWQAVVSFSQAKSLFLTAGKFVFGVLNLEVNAGFLVISSLLMLLLISSGWMFLKQKEVHKEKLWNHPITWAVWWLVVPILLGWVVSFAVPVVQPKRVLFCLPALYLILSVLITQPARSWSKGVAAALGVLLVGVNLFATFAYYTQPQYQREDWRAMYTEITTRYPTGAVAVFAFTAPFAPWDWYDQGEYPVVSTNVLTTEGASLDVLKRVTDYRYVIVFDYLRDLTDPQDQVLKTIEAYGYTEVDRITPKTPLGFVRVYARPDTTLSLQKEL